MSDTDEELTEWKTNFEGIIAQHENTISKLEREMDDMKTKSSFLRQSITEFSQEIEKLQSEAGVISIKLITYDIV